MTLHKTRYFLLITSIMLLSMSIAFASDTKKSDPNSSKSESDSLSKAMKEVEEEYGLCEDEAINEKLKRVSDKVIGVLTEDEQTTKFSFKVLDDDEVNAFAFRDGHMYFFKGLIELTKTDDQLAGVVGHEMSHIILNHSKRISNKAVPYIIGGALVAVVTGEPYAAVAGEWVANATAQSYGRKAEEEADEYGFKLMTRAGYEPIGMLQFMSFMVEEDKRKPYLFQNYFFVHPFAHERLERMKMIGRDMGYEIPDSLYRSYLESAMETREKNGIHLIDIHFGTDILLTMADDNLPRLEARASGIAKILDDLVKSGVRDFDFSINGEGTRKWIQARGRILYEPTEMDISNSEMSSDEFLKSILNRIRKLLWEERVRRGI